MLGRLVHLRIRLSDFNGDVLDVLRSDLPRTEDPPPDGTADPPAMAVSRMPLESEPELPLDPSTECECRHSRGAHIRGPEQACSFCFCEHFQEWVSPDVVEDKPLSRDVAAALERLALQPGFCDLAREHLEALGRYGRRRFFRHDSILFDRGDAGDRVYLLLTGAVQAERSSRRMAGERIVRFEPGDIVGTRAVLRRAEHAATVRALEDVFVLELTKKDVVDSFRENHSLVLAFMRMVHSRMNAARSSASSPA